MLYYINSPGYQIIKIFKVFPNPEIQRYIAKRNMFSAHFYRTKLSRIFFHDFSMHCQKRPFFEIHMCILQIILFLIFLEFQKQLLLIILIISIVLMISSISNPLDWRFSHVTDSYLNCFNYFNSPGYQIIKIIKKIKCFPHTKLEIPDPGI